MSVLVAPSLLAADFLRLGEEVEMVNRYADLFHLDIMDGRFVPNISYGFPVVEAIARKAEKPLDAHLMIVAPQVYVERFAKAGVAMISIHAETQKDPEPVLGLIRSCGLQAGLAFNPDYPLEKVYPWLDSCDFVLVMSVFAGFGGQKFIPNTLDRVRVLRAYIQEHGLNCRIEVDGGIGPDNAAQVREAGADILGAGSSVFRAEDKAGVIRSIRG